MAWAWAWAWVASVFKLLAAVPRDLILYLVLNLPLHPLGDLLVLYYFNSTFV